MIICTMTEQEIKDLMQKFAELRDQCSSAIEKLKNKLKNPSGASYGNGWQKAGCKSLLCKKNATHNGYCWNHYCKAGGL